MKFLFTADIHLKNWNDNEYFEDGTSRKINEILTAIRNMCEYAKNKKINTVIIGGDVNDTKSIASVKPFLLFKEMLEEYKEIEFHVIHGNHDIVDRQFLYSAIHLLNGPKNIHTYVDCCKIENITMIPFKSNIIDLITSSEPSDILISHFGVNEAQLSSGISVRSNINVNSLKKFNLVLLGHYHKPQQIEHIYYVGSPIPIRRDERIEEKRFLIVDSETLEVESVPTSGYRKYLEIIIDENSDLTKIKDIIQNNKDDNHLLIKKQIQNIPPELVAELSEIPIIDEYRQEYQLRGITSGMILSEQMKKYMEIREIDSKYWDRYINIALDAINSGESK